MTVLSLMISLDTCPIVTLLPQILL